MRKTLPLLLLLALEAAPARAADDMVFLVDTSTEMPMAQFKAGQLVGGIHYDLGQALAGAMGRQAVFETRPRHRLVAALDKGSADLVCTYLPQWLAGQFGWSRPFFPIVEVLLTSLAAERPRTLSDVAGEPIGTVLGYQYPEFDRVLGKGFIRDDGPTTEASLSKLALGRMRHAVTIDYNYRFRLKQGVAPMAVHAPLVVKRHLTQCAVSPKGSVHVAEVNAGIAQMLREGRVAEIVAKYR